MICSVVRAFAATFVVATALYAQDAAVPVAQRQITFKLDHTAPGVEVPHYVIELHSDGTGLYHAEPAGADSTNATSQTVDRPLVFTPATVKSAFDFIQQIRAAGELCPVSKKKVADTGTKTLTYRDAVGDGTCTYNFSENKALVQLADLFLAIEFTLEEGRALDFKHRFDRLGLDAVISSLIDSVENGRAIELGNIAPTLRSIAGDTELIQRVRLRAAKLLDRAKADASNGG